MFLVFWHFTIPLRTMQKRKQTSQLLNKRKQDAMLEYDDKMKENVDAKEKIQALQR